MLSNEKENHTKTNEDRNTIENTNSDSNKKDTKPPKTFKTDQFLNFTIAEETDIKEPKEEKKE